MKFTSIYLSNYIGIYNGMGLYEIHIDFTRCRNRVTVIRGDNGSGKSTLMKALSLFPDPNDAFIPNMPAKKEIVLVDGPTFYKITFVHDIKNNGERETTKAYIVKTFGPEIVELNPNGNVSSFKEILYSELGLDSNFVALSQLSNDDRGLADKKPAERKRFVNSIISSLEVYNGIYKILTKKSSSYKSMINALVSKLDLLGNEDVLRKNLEVVETNINALQDRKDNAVACLAQDQSRINILDPDGSIQSINKTLAVEINNLTKQLEKLDSFISSLMSANNISEVDFESALRAVIDRKNSLIIQNQIDRNNVQTLMKQKELEAEELNEKIQRVSSLNIDNLNALKDEINRYRSSMQEMEATIKTVGIDDITSLTKDEYIIALNSLKELNSCISNFKTIASYEVIQEIINYYLEHGAVLPVVNVSFYEEDKKETERAIAACELDYNAIYSKMSLLDTLKLRPSNCKNDSCSFISEAKKFADTKPEETLDALSFEIADRKRDVEVVDHLIQEANTKNNAINNFAIILREVNRNASLLSKMPNGEMFKDIKLFFERILNGYSFEYIDYIYQYIDYANLFDLYKHNASILSDLEARVREYESKITIIESVNRDIDRINNTLTKISEEIGPLNDVILLREKKIANYQELEGVYESLIAKAKERREVNDNLNSIRSKLAENNKKMEDISMSLLRIEEHRKTINDCNSNIVPLMKERDKLNHSIQMMDDYKREKAELEENYNFIETLKYYSSPTTGIQLVFMELYMGKIIALANELLSLLFNGQYSIQPFVINESEFRIPCLGGGYINDDISSMSSSQIGMISMILSFALLHNSSTKYNIIKLDEIDGPLDYNNRTYFTDVLNKIMDIMGTEQCIMISHNSELQMDNFDIILLKHDIDNLDYRRGNIIWSY